MTEEQIKQLKAGDLLHTPTLSYYIKVFYNSQDKKIFYEIYDKGTNKHLRSDWNSYTAFNNSIPYTIPKKLVRKGFWEIVYKDNGYVISLERTTNQLTLSKIIERFKFLKHTIIKVIPILEEFDEMVEEE